MTRLDDTSRALDHAPDAVIQQVPVGDEGQRRRALAVLLTGRDRPADLAVGHFINYTLEHNLRIDRLWTAHVRDRLVAASLVVPSPGRTAMLFASPATRDAPVDLVGRVVRAVCDSMPPDEAALIQTLVEPDDEANRRTIEAAGFSLLAELVYMTRRAPRKAVPLDLPGDMRTARYCDQTHALFAQAVLASYEETLDCPGLIGLRRIDDILAGHMSTGRFDPNLWTVCFRGDEPAAVMLLNPVPQRRALELVYLGVSPRFRGQGLARRLLEHGMSLARPAGAGDVVLAVDARNTPAWRLYGALRFVTQVRKHAWMRVVG